MPSTVAPPVAHVELSNASHWWVTTHSLKTASPMQSPGLTQWKSSGQSAPLMHSLQSEPCHPSAHVHVSGLVHSPLTQSGLHTGIWHRLPVHWAVVHSQSFPTEQSPLLQPGSFTHWLQSLPVHPERHEHSLTSTQNPLAPQSGVHVAESTDLDTAVILWSLEGIYVCHSFRPCSLLHNHMCMVQYKSRGRNQVF